LTRNCQEEINADFWRKRVQSAVALRSRIINRQTDAYRLINAEGDGFPGLIVDVYGRTLVISIATAGMEKQKKYILDVLLALTQAGRIYEQSEGRSRKLEGLENFRGLIFGNEQSGPATIRENGLQFEVDIPGGQKTGFFLDQRQNRETLGKISSGSRVLNCFCYTGAFSVYCAAGGAQQVCSVDISKTACAAARRHLAINNFSSADNPVLEADVFDYLRQTGECFDLIILDPPAFAKAKIYLLIAARGYKEINLQAVKRLAPGGFLATFSCSNFIGEEFFARIVLEAARDAGTDMQLLQKLQAGHDHPAAFGHQEGTYLKGLLLTKSY